MIPACAVSRLGSTSRPDTVQASTPTTGRTGLPSSRRGRATAGHWGWTAVGHTVHTTPPGCGLQWGSSSISSGAGGSWRPGPNPIAARALGIVIRTSAVLLSYLLSFSIWQNPFTSVKGQATSFGSLGFGVNGGLTVIRMRYSPGGTGSCPSPPSSTKYWPPTCLLYVSAHPTLMPW